MNKKLSECYNTRAKISNTYKRRVPIFCTRSCTKDSSHTLNSHWWAFMKHKYGKTIWYDVLDCTGFISSADIRKLSFFKIHGQCIWYGIPFWWPGPLSKIMDKDYDEYDDEEDDDYE